MRAAGPGGLAMLFAFRVGVIAAQSAIATPMCVALFDPVQEMPLVWVEPQVAEQVLAFRRKQYEGAVGIRGSSDPKLEAPVYFYRGL